MDVCIGTNRLTNARSLIIDLGFFVATFKENRTLINRSQICYWWADWYWGTNHSMVANWYLILIFKPKKILSPTLIEIIVMPAEKLQHQKQKKTVSFKSHGADVLAINKTNWIKDLTYCCIISDSLQLIEASMCWVSDDNTPFSI